MRRFFGASKPQTPGPTLDDATKKVDERVDGLSAKINKLDAELIQYRERLSRTKPGPAKDNLQRQALRVLKQKKMYEQQRDQLSNQSFNMEQANFAQQTMKDTVVTVNAMKTANVALKKELKNIKIDDIENMQDELADLLESTNEIQESLGRSYATPEFDEADLEDELNALGEELTMDETPSYLAAASVPDDPLPDVSGQAQSVPISMK